jgi:acetyl-CoA carboxylase biotin carboxyl carrier protein
MIDIRKLKELVKLMVENDLSELDLRDQEEKVTIKRGSGRCLVPMVQRPRTRLRPRGRPGARPTPDRVRLGGGSDDGLVAIESPMVGTFYSASNPDARPLRHRGRLGRPRDTVVCLVEAMKVFNEIKAEVSAPSSGARQERRRRRVRPEAVHGRPNVTPAR